MKIGLFSGSFNPIHLGHTRLAQYVLDHTPLDEVWLVVSPNNPLKAASGLLDEQLRLQMAEAATRELPHIRCSDIEFGLPKPNYTVQTLRALNERYPEHEFALIIGEDNMDIFDKWRDYDYILAHYPVYVYPRQSSAEKETDRQTVRRFPEMIVLDEAPLFPVSATEIRAKICSKTSISDWVHPEVEKILKKNADLFAYIR